ncbi:uncharacterized protein V1518DRAFT_421520 [Limtongia smithiae]|uniref:uncharacterized protein n=1 Tax=Limtongia smithiae TaxID=1125753 RepID=UPI0034CEEB32
MNAQNPLNECYNKLVSSKTRDRTDGVAALHKFLTNPDAPKLDDKKWHALFEGIIRCVLSEKSLYLRTNGTGKPNGLAESRLVAAATVFQIAVQRGVPAFRTKTFSAVTMHIVQTAFHDGEIFAPLAAEYIRALRALFGYTPHLEYLAQEPWTNLADFCATGVELLVKASVSKDDRRRVATETVDLLVCLESLVDVPTATLRVRATQIYDALRLFLGVHTVESSAHRSVFYIINKLLSCVITNDFLLYADILNDLIPVMESLWQAKSVALKEQILITAVWLYPGIKAFPKASDDPLRSFAHTIVTEYCDRLAWDMLLIDDIEFVDGTTTGMPDWLCLRNFRLSNERAIVPFLTLMILARCPEYLESRAAVCRSNDDAGVRKRRKLVESTTIGNTDFLHTHDASGADDSASSSASIAAIDVILSKLTGASDTQTIALLQLLTFIFAQPECTLSIDLLERSFVRLSTLASAENTAIASWAMVALTEIVRHTHAGQESIVEWLDIWKLCYHRVASYGTCAGSSHLLHYLLRYNLVSLDEVHDSLYSMLLSIETIGPVMLSEASISFWLQVVLKVRQNVRLMQNVDVMRRILCWMLVKLRADFEAPVRARVEKRVKAIPVVAVAKLVLVCCGRPDLLEFTSSSASSFAQFAAAGTSGAVLPFLLHYDDDFAVIDLLIRKGESSKPLIVDDAASTEIRELTAVIRFSAGHQETIVRSLCDIMMDCTEIIQDSSDTATSMVNAATDVAFLSVVVISIIAKHDLAAVHRLLHSSNSSLRRLIQAITAKIRTETSPKAECLTKVLKVIGSIDRAWQPHSLGQKCISDLLMLCKFLEDILYSRGEKSQLLTNLDEHDPEFDDGVLLPFTRDRDTALEFADVPRHWTCVISRWTCMKYQALLHFKVALIQETYKRDARVRIMSEIYVLPLMVACVNLPAIYTIVCEQYVSSGDVEAVKMVLDFIGKNILLSVEYSRSEVTVLYCVKLLDATAKLWVLVDDGNAELRDTVRSFYLFLVPLALKNNLVSYKVRCVMAEMLLHITLLDANYRCDNPKLKSAKVFLLERLRDDDLRVQFRTATMMPEFVQSFDMSDHLGIYTDIRNILNLPETESLIIRAFALAKLASASPVLVQDSVFNLVEMIEKPLIGDYIEYCFHMAAIDLGLRDSRELFRVFCSEILFTWLTEHMLTDFRYEIFGYESQADFLRTNYEEYVAQFLARYLSVDRERAIKEIDGIASYLGASRHEIILRSLPRIVAYLFGSLVANQQQDGAMSVLNILADELGGGAALISAVSALHPTTLAYLYQIADMRDSKKLNDRDFASFGKTAAGWMKLNRFAVPVDLPTPMNPWFHVQTVLASMKRLEEEVLQGAERNFSTTRSSTVYILRLTINMLDRAINPYYACKILKVLKLCIFLEQQVMDIYAAKMCLHAVIPLIKYPQCIGDVLDIVEHFFDGKVFDEDYTLMTRFTVQCMYFVQIVEHAKPEFLVNNPTLVQHIYAFKSQLNVHVTRTFMNATKPLVNRKLWLQSLIWYDACAAKGLPGWSSANVRQVIDLDQYHDPITRRYGLKLLEHELTRPRFGGALNDLLLDDYDCSRTAKDILLHCKTEKFSDAFTLWLARVCARDYEFSGIIHHQWYDPIDNLTPIGGLPSNLKLVASYFVFTEVAALLDSEDRVVASSAEGAMRIIVKQAELSGDGLPNMIEAYVVDAMRLESADVTWQIACDAAEQKAVIAQPRSFEQWACHAAGYLCSLLHAKVYGIIAVLIKIVNGFAEKVFQYLVLEYVIQQRTEDASTDAIAPLFNDVCQDISDDTIQHASLLIRCFIFLQTQTLPNEKTRLDRFNCIPKLNRTTMVVAAIACKLYPSALHICECLWSCGHDRESMTTRLVEIYKGIDDPDALYGVRMLPTIQSLLNFAEFEHDGWKSLSYHGAMLDNKETAEAELARLSGISNSFSSLGMNGLAMSMATTSGLGDKHSELIYRAAWKLGKWDIPAPSDSKSPQGVIYKVLQALNAVQTFQTTTSPLTKIVQDSSVALVRRLSFGGVNTAESIREMMNSLAVISEVAEVWHAAGPEKILEVVQAIEKRGFAWTRTARMDIFEDIKLGMQSVLSSLGNLTYESSEMDIQGSLRLHEVALLRKIIQDARKHGELQRALSLCISLRHLSDKVSHANKVTVQRVQIMETSQMLWDKGDRDVAIQMLQGLVAVPTSGGPCAAKLGLEVGTSTICALLARWTSIARQERPEDIYTNYVVLGVSKADEIVDNVSRSHAFHEFALFCDGQLKSESNLEDFRRIERMRAAKFREVTELQRLTDHAPNSERKQLRTHLNKVRMLYESDNEEYKRLSDARAKFLDKSITFYLHSLSMSDEFDEDSFRLCSLWLANSTNPMASEAMRKTIGELPTAKLVGWVNQLSSRLLDEATVFQQVLCRLITQLCKDHPFHCLYQLFAIINSTDNTEDADHSAQLRQSAAAQIWRSLKADRGYAARYLSPIEELSRKAIVLANYPPERLTSLEKVDKLFWRSLVKKLRIPPPTFHIPLRANKNYDDVPAIEDVSTQVQIASGLSRPKVVNFLISTGAHCCVLMKGGNNDLRQDAIMEQVFDQVNNFLQRNESTRNRNMRVRTYGVTPLSYNAGVIEFVPDTQALLDIISPLHKRYYPEDWEVTRCSTILRECQAKSNEERVREYRKVVAHVHPVLRHFFFEKFDTPRVWQERMTAYTRSTAAISILGNMLGLGDRHCNNILIHSHTGEPVHIDLGVAFEQGRVLQIPETVPFRLTRDIVDGMGINGTEGVFRRCCGFMLDVLRQEADNIMAVLDVLRYDPLYSWTISPLRKKRLQDGAESPAAVPTRARKSRISGSGNAELITTSTTATVNTTTIADAPAGSENESEAERALLVVSQKLSNSLSVDAAVNQLIQEASDERNLALIYCGWRAYF